MRNYSANLQTRQVSRRMLMGEFPGQSHVRLQIHRRSLMPTSDSVLLPFIALLFTCNINYAIRVA